MLGCLLVRRTGLSVAFRSCGTTPSGGENKHQHRGITQLIGHGVHQKSSFFPLQGGEGSPHNSATPAGESSPMGFVRRLDFAKRFFMPAGYPRSVSEDYWNVQKHWNVQWAASSALQVFATQSLLTSVGVGSGIALPLAATANWVLKVSDQDLISWCFNSSCFNSPDIRMC